MTSIRLLNIAVITLISVAFTTKKPNGRLPKEIRHQYSYVPGGTMDNGGVEVKVGSYFMKHLEVTNGEYLEFIEELERTGNTKLLKVALPDTAAWRMNNSINEPFVIHYFRHKAYRNYPVVCVSYAGALAWCDWKSQKASENTSVKEYHAFYRLPTKQEWIMAAMNDHPKSVYSWGGAEINNVKGCALCNFRQTPEDTGADPSRPFVHDDNADITAPVMSYSPNNWGFYNMNGNVAEMISEKGIAMGGSWNSPKDQVTNTSKMSYEGGSPMIGFRPVVVYIMPLVD